jgi:putative oxidoreductase
MSEPTAMLAGRVLMGLGFLAFGIWNVGNRSVLSGLFAARGMPLPGVMAGIGIGTQTACGLLLAAGIWTQLAALSLIAFVIAATVLVHLPLGTNADQRRENGIACLMNVIVVGGLLSYAHVDA